jgi:hypothetical protein
MGFLIELFTVDELRRLDARDLEILKAAIQKELRTSAGVRDAIRAAVRNVYNSLVAKNP